MSTTANAPAIVFLRACAVCDMPIFRRRFQDDKARACSGHCAARLFHKEYPDHARAWNETSDNKRSM